MSLGSVNSTGWWCHTDIMSNLGLGMGGVGATTYQITLNGIRLAQL
jgi:hypothetical protein